MHGGGHGSHAGRVALRGAEQLKTKARHRLIQLLERDPERIEARLPGANPRQRAMGGLAPLGWLLLLLGCGGIMWVRALLSGRGVEPRHGRPSCSV
jgi:hypothetical protein